MNKNMLYRLDGNGNKICKICGVPDDHVEECPGAVVEDLLYFVRVSDPWDDVVDGTSSDTIEGAIAFAASENTHYEGSKAHLFYTSSGRECTARYLDASRAEQTKRKAQEAERVRGVNLKNMEAEFRALKSEEHEFTPEAFQRRWAAIEAKYADVVKP